MDVAAAVRRRCLDLYKEVCVLRRDVGASGSAVLLACRRVIESIDYLRSMRAWGRSLGNVVLHDRLLGCAATMTERRNPREDHARMRGSAVAGGDPYMMHAHPASTRRHRGVSRSALDLPLLLPDVSYLGRGHTLRLGALGALITPTLTPQVTVVGSSIPTAR